jgi:hypothetical protein
MLKNWINGQTLAMNAIGYKWLQMVTLSHMYPKWNTLDVLQLIIWVNIYKKIILSHC